MEPDKNDLDAELRSLLAEGRRIEAIKRYVAATGAELAEAKQAVEALQRGQAETAGSGAEAEIVAMLEAGRKIEAIKAYRELMGVGLKEAKDAIEAIAAARNIPAKSGCLGVVLLAILLGAAALAGQAAAPRAPEMKLCGKRLWEKTAKNHADCTAIFDLGPGKAILMSICSSGPAWCLSPEGKTVWEKTTKEVSHGQGAWVGNFIFTQPDSDGRAKPYVHRPSVLQIQSYF